MQEYFTIMDKAPYEANLLLSQLLGSSFREEYIRKTWNILHPNADWVPTLIINSEIMDKVPSPEVRIGKQWEYRKLCEALLNASNNDSITLDYLLRYLSDVWPLLSQDNVNNPWTDDMLDKLENELGLESGSIKKLVNEVRESLVFVKLGCCIPTDKQCLAILEQYFPKETISKFVDRSNAVQIS